MAQLYVNGLDDIFHMLDEAGEATGELARQMLEAGAAVCVDAWKNAIGKSGHVKTGAMQKSVGVKYQTKDGVLRADIYPLGKDETGTRNAEKAFILHYGSSHIKGSRFVDDAEREAEERALPVMQEIWNNGGK